MIINTKYLSNINSIENLNQNIKEISKEILEELDLEYLKLYNIKVNPIYSTFVPISSKFKSFNLDMNKYLHSIDDFMKKFSLVLLDYFKNIYNKDYRTIVTYKDLKNAIELDMYPDLEFIKDCNFLPFYFDGELYTVLVMCKGGETIINNDNLSKIEVLCMLAKLFYFRSKSVDLIKIEGKDIVQHDMIEFYSELLRKISNNLPGFIYKFETTKDDRIYISFTSEKIENIFGLSFEDVSEDISKIFDIIHPDDKLKIYDSIIESKNNLTIWKEVFRVILDGKVKWISGEARPERELNGKTIWYGYITDISEHQMLQLKLEESEAYKNAILNAVNKSVIVSVADLKGRILNINEAFVDISGFPRIELIGSDHNIVNSKHHDRKFWIDMWKTISKGISWRERIKNKTKDGEYYWVDTVINPILDRNGKIYEYLSIRYDITKEVLLEEEKDLLNKNLKKQVDKKTQELKKNILEIKNHNEELYKKQLELNNAMQVKDQFLSIVAHDIRNHLTSISLLSDMLRDYWNKLEDDAKIEKISKISSSTSLLDEFLKELLLWSKTLSGNIDFKPVEQDLIPVLNNLLALFKLNPANEKKICDFDHDQKMIFEFDSNILSTILRNLLTNAIKFTDPDGVISIYFEESEDFINIIVKDNGIGMTDKQLEILLDKSQSKRNISNSKNKGTGLGVNLCIELVKMHKGTILFESQVNIGTKVTLTLPKHY